MFRKNIAQLEAWKGKSFRKPLIVRGARQVGKTHLLQLFGESYFERSYVFDFEKQSNLLIPLFEDTLTPKSIIQSLSLHVGHQINIATDLLIFDEIQNCPRAISSLKYFCEEMPHAYICTAGSLLGVKLSSEAFPVGKVEYLDMYPMSYEEFLYATSNDMLIDIYRNFDFKPNSIPKVAHSQFWDLLKQYYVTGGMPEAIQAFINCGGNHMDGFMAARKIQKNLLRDYHADVSKHSGKLNAMHIISVLENIPMQLSTMVDASTRRFYFKDVIPGKKGFSSIEGPINWLVEAGLVYKIMINNRSELPIKSFCKPNIFKLMLLDHGLLAASLDLPPKSIILQNYGITKGYFAESMVAHELIAAGHEELYCWMERNCEIEFLQIIKNVPCPIEVKAGHRTQAKSLKQYISTYNPPRSVKITAQPFSITDARINLPLYLTGKLSPDLCFN